MSGLSLNNLDYSPVIEHEAFAVGLSGGGDSVALLHKLASVFPGKIIHALIVDHGLRPESAAEALGVFEFAQKITNVRPSILRWEGEKPDTRIMEAARQARYALMADYCRAHKLGVLAVAHHGDDQRETMLMRLARGSGVDGLAGMRALTVYDGGLKIWRPLLGVGHKDLIDYCKNQGLSWVDDPSNYNDDYMRVRMRGLGAALEGEGLDAERTAQVCARLLRAAEALELWAERLYEGAILESERGKAFDLAKIRAEPLEIVIRLLRRVLDEQGLQSGYGARYGRVEALANEVCFASKRFKTTLGCCVIVVNVKAGRLEILPEK